MEIAETSCEGSDRTLNSLFLISKKITAQRLLGLFLCVAISDTVSAGTPGNQCQKALLGLENQSQLQPMAEFNHRDSENPQLFQLLRNLTSTVMNDELKLFVTKTPAEQLLSAKQALEQHKVAFTEEADKHFFGLLKKQKLLISPINDGSPLNRLASSLKRTLNVNLIYKPHALTDGTTAYFDPNSKEIGLSHRVVLAGEPDILLFHEIRHAALQGKSLAGQPSLFEATVVMSDREIPTHRPYEHYLSFQEVETYFQDANYAYHASRSPQVDSLPLKDQRYLLGKVGDMIRLSIDIFKFSKRRLMHASKLLTQGGGDIYAAKKSENVLLVALGDRSYQFEFQIGHSEVPQRGLERPFLLEHINSMIKEIDSKQAKMDERHRLNNIRMLSFLNR